MADQVNVMSTFIPLLALPFQPHPEHTIVQLTVIPLILNTNDTPSIHPNLGLPLTSPPLTVGIITLFAMHCSCIIPLSGPDYLLIPFNFNKSA